MPRDGPTQKVSPGEEVSLRMDSWGNSVPGRGYKGPGAGAGLGGPGVARPRGEEEERSSCEDPAFSVSEMEADGGLGMEDTSTVLAWNRILSASVLRTGCRGQHGGRELCSRNSSSQMLGSWISIVVVEMLGSHGSGYTEGRADRAY